MQSKLKMFKGVAVLVAGVAMGFSSLVAASGTESGPSAQSNETQLYNTGKGVYSDKLGCSNCPLAGKSLDAMLAKDILAGNPKVALNGNEQEALAVYLKRRFKLERMN